MKKFVPVIILIVVILTGVLLFKSQSETLQSTLSQTKTTQTPVEEKNNQISFENPKKSAHYETNTPSHGALLAGVPLNIVIDFNFDLGKKSTISITNNGKEYGVGESTIDENKLTLRRSVDPLAPEGVYMVNYNACWPDNSCHDGYFQFAIEKTKAVTFTDLTQKKAVKVTMKDIKFIPQNIRISKGTKVTWVNDDLMEHYVNTDSHPAHTYYKDQNSKALQKGDEYSVVFAKTGEYLYHCSAHAGKMIGSIFVDN